MSSLSINRRRLIQKSIQYIEEEWEEGRKNGNDINHPAFSIEQLRTNDEIAPEDRVSLLTALFQSGKTFLVASIMVVYLAAAKTCVLLVTDSPQATQAIDRLQNVFDTFASSMRAKGVKEKYLTPYQEILFQDSKSVTKVEDKIKRAIEGKRPRLIICYRHHTHLDRINQYVTDSTNFALFIDEAHNNAGYRQVSENVDELHDPECIYDEAVNEAKGHAFKIFVFTATCEKVCATEPELYLKNVFFNVSHRDYRGPTALQWEIIPEPVKNSDAPKKPKSAYALFCEHERHSLPPLSFKERTNELATKWKSVSIHDKEHFTDMAKRDKERYRIEKDAYGPEEKESTAYKLLDDLSCLSPFDRVRWDGKVDKHPIILLVHTERTNEGQHELLRAFYNPNSQLGDARDADWLVMTFNQNGICVWKQDLVDEVITIGGVTADDSGNGEHVFPGILPADVLDWAVNNGGVNRFPRIVFVAYFKADEGMSYSTYNGPRWHLTHLVQTARNLRSDKAAQVIARLFGNHSDTIPITAVVPKAVQKQFMKEVNLTDEFVREIQDMQKRGENIRVKEWLSRRDTFKNRVPKGFLKELGNHDESIKTVDNPNKKAEDKAMQSKFAIDYYVFRDKGRYEEEAAQLKVERLARGEIIPENNAVHEEKNVRLRSTTSLDKVREIWKEKHGQQLHLLINECIRRGFASISSSKLEALGIKVSNFTRWDIKHNKYKILEKTETGRYNLRSEIIDHLDLLE